MTRNLQRYTESLRRWFRSKGRRGTSLDRCLGVLQPALPKRQRFHADARLASQVSHLVLSAAVTMSALLVYCQLKPSPALAEQKEMSLRANWANRKNRTLDVKVFNLSFDNVKTCVEAGFESRLRLDIQICKYRSVWWDRCEGRHTVERRIAREVLSTQYSVTPVDSENPQDDEEDETIRMRDIADAMAEMAHMQDVPLVGSNKVSESLLSNPKSYVSVRATLDCTYNPSAQGKAALLLALGRGAQNKTTSGWVEFWVNSDKRK